MQDTAVEPFQRGRTFFDGGTVSTTDNASNQLVGREFWMPDANWNAAGIQGARSNAWVLVRAVRNGLTVAASGSAAAASLLPKRLVNLQQDHNAVGAPTGTAGLTARGTVVCYARTAEEKAYPVDEYLPAAGCPVGDICYIVLEGPAMVVTPGASFASVLPSNLVAVSTCTTAGATDSAHTNGGKAYIFDGAHTAKGAVAHLGIVGRCLSARTTDNTNSDLLIDVIRTY